MLMEGIFEVRSKVMKRGEIVTVKAKVTRGVFPEYQGEGPVLEAVEVKPAAKPKEEVISFT